MDYRHKLTYRYIGRVCEEKSQACSFRGVMMIVVLVLLYNNLGSPYLSFADAHARDVRMISLFSSPVVLSVATGLAQAV